MLGNPLQIFLLTELFLQDLNYYIRLLDTFFSAADLYKHFVKAKFFIYFKDKEDANIDNDWALERFKKFKKTQIKFYQTIAMETYFCGLETNNSNFDEILKEIQNEADHVGFIVKIENKNVEYLHNSFGEYFAASYLASKTDLISKIQNFLLRDKHTNIRFFFDLILAKNCKAHLAVLYKNVKVLNECDEKDLFIKDREGRNPLHLHCSWCTKYRLLHTKNNVVDAQELFDIENEKSENLTILEILLRTCDPNDFDDLLSFDSYFYAKESHCFFTLGILTNMDRQKMRTFGTDIFNTILYYCIRFDYFRIFDFIEDVPNVTFRNTFLDLVSIPHLAVKFSSVNTLEKILSHKNQREIIRKSTRPLIYDAFKNSVF